jgi:hypothetical protein
LFFIDMLLMLSGVRKRALISHFKYFQYVVFVENFSWIARNR